MHLHSQDERLSTKAILLFRQCDLQMWLVMPYIAERHLVLLMEIACLLMLAPSQLANCCRSWPFVAWTITNAQISIRSRCHMRGCLPKKATVNQAAQIPGMAHVKPATVSIVLANWPAVVNYFGHETEELLDCPEPSCIWPTQTPIRKHSDLGSARQDFSLVGCCCACWRAQGWCSEQFWRAGTITPEGSISCECSRCKGGLVSASEFEDHSGCKDHRPGNTIRLRRHELTLKVLSPPVTSCLARSMHVQQ